MENNKNLEKKAPDKKEIKIKLIKHISTFNFVKLMRLAGFEDICFHCSNIKWKDYEKIKVKESNEEWGYVCKKGYELYNCKGEEFNPSLEFIKLLNELDIKEKNTND